MTDQPTGPTTEPTTPQEPVAPAAPPSEPTGRAARRRAEGATGDRRTWALAGAAFAAIALIVVAFFVIQGIGERRAAAEKLGRAIELVEAADTVVVQIDGVVREEVTPELAERARGASARVADAREGLEEAVRLVETARPDLNDDEREQADLLEEAARARLEMLDHAPAILSVNEKAGTALPLAEQAWDLTLSADKLSDQAVSAYNKLTKAGVQQSRTLNRQAASELASASALFAEAGAAFPEAGLDRYSAYVASRIRLNQLSQESDAAWLKGDLAKANQIIKTYNAEDKRAVGLAKALPPSPRQAIATAYEAASQDETDRYYDARERATQADQRLRRL